MVLDKIHLQVPQSPRKDAKYHGSYPCATGLTEELSQRAWLREQGGWAVRGPRTRGWRHQQNQGNSWHTESTGIVLLPRDRLTRFNTSGTIKAALNPRNYYPRSACKSRLSSLKSYYKKASITCDKPSLPFKKKTFLEHLCAHTGSWLQHTEYLIFIAGMAHGIFSRSMQTPQLQHVGSSPLTRDQTQASCAGSVES